MFSSGVRGSLAGLVLLASTVLFAQQQEDGQPQPEVVSEEQGKTAERREVKDNPVRAESPETFVPSEDISQDRSVSFPTDI